MIHSYFLFIFIDKISLLLVINYISRRSYLLFIFIDQISLLLVINYISRLVQ
jgi:hypothetical protein